MSGAFRALLPAVILAGAASLAEEIAWARTLRRIVGSTTGATALVVAGMLGGMALGSWIGQALLRRPAFSHPRGALRAWAFSALASAAAAVLFTAACALAEAADALAPGTDAALLILLVLAAVPSGAGFPLVVGALGIDAPPRRIGILFGAGCLGGAAGAILLPLWGVPFLGERQALGLAAALQALAGVGILLVARPIGGLPGPEPLTAGVAAILRRGPGSGPGPGPGGVVLFKVFLAGLAVIYWEMVWTRILTLVVGASVHAFAAAAGSVILGIGIGSILFCGRSRGGREWALPLGVLGILTAAFFAVPYLPDVYLAGIRAAGGPVLELEVGGAALVVLVACAPLGLILPWALEASPERSGVLQAAYGIGAALGAFLGGPLLAGRM